MDIKNLKDLEYIEFETKYFMEEYQLLTFKKIVESIKEDKSFLYVEGKDFYYVKEDMPNSFARYRSADYGLDNGRSEVTIKTKPIAAKNNIKRQELNWRVDKTPEKTIMLGLETLGFKFNFSIWKSCHIIKLNDATLVFYTVYETTGGVFGQPKSFLEIEVSEEKISEMTEDQAWGIIEKYEKLLAPTGLTPQKRLKKSLFEMYRR